MKKVEIRKEVYTVKEFCYMFDVNKSTYYRWKIEGFLPKLMKVGRRVYITHEALMAWKKKMEK